MTTRRSAPSTQPRRPVASISRGLLAVMAPLLPLLPLLITAMPAQAANNYTFPGNLPAGCSGSNEKYSCGALTLQAGDTITVTGAANVTVSGALNIGENTLINATGSASNLNFNVGGVFNLGGGSTLHANVSTGESAANIGASAIIVGNITTGNGVVTTLASIDMNGNITTTGSTTGTVNLGANNAISGNIHTVAGVVNVGDNTKVNGYIQTNAGAVNLGVAAGNNTVTGNITTQAGVVTIVPYGTVGGHISTADGAVTISHDSRVCYGISTGAGVVTLTDTLVGASIVTGAGGITVTGTRNKQTSTVGVDIQSTGAGVIVLTDVDVGGNLIATTGTLTTTRANMRGSVSSGSGAYTHTDSTSNNGTVSFPPACASPVAPVTPTITEAASFDALETEANLAWSATARKPLYTKLAGTPFTIDIAALKKDGMLESAYVASGGAAKHVKLELFDDVGAVCSAYTSPVASQTASFTSTLFSGVLGRALSGAITVADAHKSLLVRIKECVDNTCTAFTSVTPACSSDRFSVRPSALTLSSTTGMAIAPSPTASQTINAGADFTLLAKTSTKANYDGVLTLDTTKLTAQLPTEGVNARSGGINGILTPSKLTANANPVPATYSEVGYLYIGPGAYRDDNFTTVDSTAADCITSTANDANLADTLIGGKYGCSIGNRAISSMGRFVPDHFSTVIADGAAMPCPAALIASGHTCPAAGFVYSGQPFAITITALNANGLPTLNYHGLLARDVTLDAWSAPGSIVAAGPAGSVLRYSPSPVSAATFIQGVAGAIPAYTFPARYPASALAAPTVIHLRAHENSTTANNVTSARPAAPLSSIEGGVTVVSGRIKVDNNYGSELLAMPMMTRAQYWDGVRFVGSTTDASTSFNANDVLRSDCKLLQNGRQINDPGCQNAAAMPASPAMNSMTNGLARFKLAAPGAGDDSSPTIRSVDIRIESSTTPWLPSTKARIGVGIYRSGPIIYMREMH